MATRAGIERKADIFGADFCGEGDAGALLVLGGGRRGGKVEESGDGDSGKNEGVAEMRD